MGDHVGIRGEFLGFVMYDGRLFEGEGEGEGEGFVEMERERDGEGGVMTGSEMAGVEHWTLIVAVHLGCGLYHFTCRGSYLPYYSPSSTSPSPGA